MILSALLALVILGIGSCIHARDSLDHDPLLYMLQHGCEDMYVPTSPPKTVMGSHLLFARAGLEQQSSRSLPPE
jgi:hypothetical protein